MIDLISLDIDIQHTPFGNRNMKENTRTGIVTLKHLSSKVKIYPEANAILVTSLDNGARINIRCNPLKPVQGHNVFGTDNVIGLGFRLIQFVLEALGIVASRAQLQAWEEGKYTLRELHITYRFRLPSHELLEPLVTHILRNIHVKYRPAVLKTGVGITLCNPESHAEWMLYDKLQYLCDKRHDEFEHLLALVDDERLTEEIWERLLKAATGSLRAELRLGKAYLKSEDLNTAAQWRRGRPKEVFLEELALLRLGQAAPLESVRTMMETLRDNMPLYQTFRLWLTGDDIRAYGAESTTRKHRTAIKERTGIDILLDHPPKKVPEFDLRTLFDPANIGGDFPSWTKDYPQIAYKGSGLDELRTANVARARMRKTSIALAEGLPDAA